MFFPSSSELTDAYFDEALKFLSDSLWLYKHRATELFRDKFWETIPEFKDDFVHDFCLRCSQLSLSRTCTSNPEEHSLGRARGIKPKKAHELELFSALVLSNCQRLNCDVVIDIGCGLGHLCDVLRASGLTVIGIDSQQQFCEKKNESVPRTGRFIAMRIENTEDCLRRLSKEFEDLASKRVALVGLHCCGDLHANVLRIFTHFHFVKVCLCVSCCYHRMVPSAENFPLSSMLSSKLTSKTSSHWPLAFRLASEQTLEMWNARTPDEKEAHFRSICYRAIGECYANELPEKVRTRLRKVRSSSFDEYASSFLSTFDLSSTEMDYGRQRLSELYNTFKPHFQLVETYSVLQLRLQSVIESLLIVDRAQFVRECGLAVHLVPVFDAVVSPRNICFTAEKVG